MSVYSRILENQLIPLYYSLRGRSYGSRRKLLEESQWWSREKVREFQWRELQKLLAHVFQTVPYYQEKYRGAGARLEDIGGFDDFARLPPLTRAEVNAHRERLCSTAYTGRLISHATGGSSGVPTRFYITPESYDWRSAASSRAYAWSGCRLGERALYLWGAPIGKVGAAKSWKTRAYRGLRRELVFNTFKQSDALWAEILEAARRFRPHYVVGYVASLEQFGRYLLARNASMPGIRGVVAAAEPVFENTRELVRKAYRAPLFNTYGSREFMSMAAECDRHDGLHIHAENILIETANPASQEPSEFLVTDLHNYGMPLVRYEIGDMGLLTDRACPCGRGLPLVEQIDGRVLDTLRTRDGRVVPGELFPHLLKDIVEVQEFQVEQKTLEEIHVYVVLSGPLSERSREIISSEIGKAFGGGTAVTLHPVESIPKRASGKRRVTIGLQQQSI
jgi:phenylacetate-CoA ligase